MTDTTFLTMHRKNGTVEVVSTDAGWFITGRGKTSTLRMRIPRCTYCASWSPKTGRPYRRLCTVIHGSYLAVLGGYPSVPSFNNPGNDCDHERRHCHGGHVERVRKLIDAVARTYGPAVK